jgi:hypothetical protein
MCADVLQLVLLPDTIHAPQRVPDEACPARFRSNPRSRLPGRIVPHVLGVAALQVGDPMSFLVLMEADDLSRDRRPWLCIGVQSALDAENSDCPFLAVSKSVVDEHELARNVRQHLEHHSAPGSNGKSLNAA